MTETKRRTPKQNRSREKVEAILSAAQKLIGDKGNDAVSVREIATQAGVSIAAVYQYFPDKNAIIRQLMSRYLDEINAQYLAAFQNVKDLDDLQQALDNSIDAFVAYFCDTPALATIWAGVQANPALRELDAEDSRVNAEFFAAEIKRLFPPLDEKKIYGTCLFFTHMAGALVRQVLPLDQQTRNILVEEYKVLMKMRLTQEIAGD